MVELTSEVVRSFEAKRERRLALARLPYTEKVKILIQLQSIAAPLLIARSERAVIFRSDE
jgi:hypothetical protein